MNDHNIIDTIFEAIDEVNLQREGSDQVEKTPQTRLFGKESKLDSLGLVNLIVLVEEKVSDKFNAIVTLADERAMSQKHSPFKSVQSLADYIQELLEEPK